MIKWAVTFFFVALCSPAFAQTYFGDGNSTTGKGGSCCTWVASSDLNGQACSAGDLAARPTCQVITQAQFDAFVAAVAKPAPKCNPGTVVSDGANLRVCAVDGSSYNKYPLTVLGTAVVVIPQ